MNRTDWLEVSLYEGSDLIARARARSASGEVSLVLNQSRWEARAVVDDRDDLLLHFVATGEGATAAAGISWEFAGWAPEVYVLMPAGAYAGNRFQSIRVPYSPRVPEELVRGVETPELITDVPRLSDKPGPSRIQLKSGDLAFPGFGWFDPRTNKGWFVAASHPVLAASWLWEIDESRDRSVATFRVAAPGVRQSPVYRLPMMSADSPDRAGVWKAGERRELRLRVREWQCADIPEFLDRVASLRAELREGQEVSPVLPMRAAASLIEEHYNRDAWRESHGFYATDCNPGSHYAFQTGWCGGMIATLPLLIIGAEQTRARARRTLETFFANAPRPCGLFWGKCTRDGVWTADFTHDKARPYTHTWTLTRRQADALWYLIRQIEWLEATDSSFHAPPAWDRALQACADVFVMLWKRYRQFGQFLHQHTAEILIGGSTSGALVPAALCAAWRRYKKPEYLEVAQSAGRAFGLRLSETGYTNGGPGDALQNPDSESCAALVESFAELHACTRDAEWLRFGKTAAALLSTWVMPYNFPFPQNTEFGRHGIRTRGSVFANTQNKHSAPGICTHAGVGLFHLYRATGDERWMDLLCEIARFLPQVVSRPGCEIRAKDGRALPSGWINERVNTSDWDDNLGGVFYGSTWSEVALLLTAVELPSVYVRPDLKRVWCLDHVEAQIQQKSVCLPLVSENPPRSERVYLPFTELSIRNPTTVAAAVRVLIDDKPDQPIPSIELWRLPVHVIPPGLFHREQLKKP